MGPRVMRRLPRYVHVFIDRHGRGRYYFRKAGHKKVALPGLPFSTEFMDAYTAATEGTPRIEVGANRSKPGSVAVAVAGYFASASFAAGLAPTTRSTRKRILSASASCTATSASPILGRRTLSAWWMPRRLHPVLR